MKQDDHAEHPGSYVRTAALKPKGISITAAAKLLGIGRPAVSNFINGRAAASPEMAARIERAFAIPAQTILDMQGRFDAAEAKARGTAGSAKAYVAPFLAIKANDIEAWASPNISARVRLSVLLRILVHSTTTGLLAVDFPGNDDAQRPGWDGFVDANEATPWVPVGRSGWEFGTNQDIKNKADDDFAKSARAVSQDDRLQTTFVFVTPRRWPGKAAWVTERKKAGQWKDVKAYDASDLEQWLEQSISGQAWFANETGMPSLSVRSPDKCWDDWARVCTPRLAKSLFSSALPAAARSVRAKLATDPGRPVIITADSSDEALAFVAQLFSEDGELAAERDRVLVFDEPGVAPKIAEGAKSFIAVTSNRDVERELARFASELHIIAVYPRNAVEIEPDVRLEPLNYTAFRESMEGMGFGRDDVDKFSRESGRSLTVLRRRLSEVPAIRSPGWASKEQGSGALIAFLFVGAWNSANKTDQAVLCQLAGEQSYAALEREFQRLALLNDAPVWSAGTFRGIVSKIDLLFAIASSITANDLRRYFEIALKVLGEDDPALDLPESERWWKAAHQGKVRAHSGALRSGISETLVLLSVHGKQLFASRLGVDPHDDAVRLVRSLLVPTTTRRLEANDQDLPTYAEATPETFLEILKDDLASPEPACFGLLRPVKGDVFGSKCARTGLLWALESLAWSPETMSRAVDILARLAEIEIDDNWVNKPSHSLESIFRSWMPQTAASLDERIAAAKMLAQKYPAIGWKIATNEFGGQQTGDYSYKPRWRTDGHGFGEPLASWGPIIAFRKEMIELAFNQASYDQNMLCDLIEKLPDLEEPRHADVWRILEAWAPQATDAQKAVVREKVRVTVLSRRGMRRLAARGNPVEPTAAASLCAMLEPSDLLLKHEWLFREAWVQESADELTEDIDLPKRDEWVADKRTVALREIADERGVRGVFELAEMGKSAAEIGRLMVTRILATEDVADFLHAALPPGSNGASWAQSNVIFGGLHALGNDERKVVLREMRNRLSVVDFARLLQLAPFGAETWSLVDELDQIHRDTYWDDVDVRRVFGESDEQKEAVERLLAARRPRAAFALIRYKPEEVEPRLLFRLLSDVATDGRDKPGEYRLDSYRLKEAFSILSKSSDVSPDDKAQLEFAYLDVLAERWGSKLAAGITNLEIYIEKHPELFVQAVVWTYRRNQRGDDPPEWRIAPDKIEHFAKRGNLLLDSLRRTPGHNHLGVLDRDTLAAWVKTVRDACGELDRTDIADICLGKLFSHAPVGSDGVWPCEPVRDVIEELRSEHIARGVHTGLYNSRGVVWRGESGDQERVLAAKYRTWSQALRYSHPHVASIIDSMVKTYEGEADREDTQAKIRSRLH